MACEGTKRRHLLLSWGCTCSGEKGGAGFQKWRVFRERSSTFSLEFPAIEPSVSGESRSKVAPHNKGYMWVTVLWSFDKLQEVGVFSYLIYPLFKCFVNAWVDLRP